MADQSIDDALKTAADPGHSSGRRSVLDADQRLQATASSPLRWLVILVPLAVIAIFGANLAGLWTLPGQQAAKELPQPETLHDPWQAVRDARDALEDLWGRLMVQLDSVTTSGPQHSDAPTGPSDVPSASTDGGSVHNSPEESTIRSIEDIERQIEAIFGKRRAPADGRADSGADDGAPSEGSQSTAPAPDAPGPEARPRTFDPDLAVALVAIGDVEAGRMAFKKCAPCHTVKKGEFSRLGPDLWGIVGRPVAAAEDYYYSKAMKSLDGAWSERRLARFLHDPKAMLPGTKMTFAGIVDEKQVADLIVYLKSRSDGGLP
ncbi:MAG: cytochrome c family protein [Hyphomicrobium sp.]|nr:cytochrome c family protein [Hyphomicrobium sp.]